MGLVIYKAARVSSLVTYSLCKPQGVRHSLFLSSTADALVVDSRYWSIAA